MRRNDESRAENYIARRKKYRKWGIAISVLSVCVAITTLYLLNKPATAVSETAASTVGMVLPQDEGENAVQDTGAQESENLAADTDPVQDAAEKETETVDVNTQNDADIKAGDAASVASAEASSGASGSSAADTTADSAATASTQDTKGQNSNEKGNKLTASYVDGTDQSIREDSVLQFDDTLDLTKAPAEISGYQYEKAFIDGKEVKSIRKITSSDTAVAGSASDEASSSDSEDISYLYTTTDDQEITVSADINVKFVYTASKDDTRKAISLKATLVDEFGTEIDPVKYTKIDLPQFGSDGILYLDDAANSPYADITVTDQNDAFKVTKYTYMKASIEDETVVALRKDDAVNAGEDDSAALYTSISEAVSSDASDAASSACSADAAVQPFSGYSYTTDGTTWKELTEDTVIKMSFSDGKKTEYVYEDSTIKVTAKLQKANAIPDDAELKVTPVTQETKGYDYDAYMKALNKNANAIDKESGNTENSSFDETSKQNDAYNKNNTLLYDIAFMTSDQDTTDGKPTEYEPTDGAVTLSVEFKNQQLSKDLAVEKPADLTVIHLPLKDDAKDNITSTKAATDITADDVNVDVIKTKDLSVDAKENQVAFSTDSLSVYVFNNGQTQTNTWDGDKTFKIDDVINKLGWANNFAVFANELDSNTHIEGNIAVGDYHTNGGERLNANDNLYKYNAIKSITVTKTLKYGDDNTFWFGVFTSPTADNPIYNFSIQTSSGSGSSKFGVSYGSAIYNSLQTGPIYIYELTQQNGAKVPDGGKNGIYKVNYTSGDQNNTVNGSCQISNIDMANYIGNFYVPDETILDPAYFGRYGTYTYFGSGSINQNFVSKKFSENKSVNNATEITTFNNNKVYVSDYGNNNNTNPSNFFAFDSNIHANIQNKLTELRDYSVELANAKNGAVSNSTDYQTLNVINLKSTTGKLQDDLNKANFYEAGNGGFIKKMFNSNDETECQYLLINIDATGLENYTLEKLVIDGIGPDTNVPYTSFDSHVIYNFVKKDAAGNFVPYDGQITNPDVVGGIIFAPAATIIQQGGMYGEIIADKVDRITKPAAEIHKKNLTSFHYRDVTVSVTNTAPNNYLDLNIKKFLDGADLAAGNSQFEFQVDRLQEGNTAWENNVVYDSSGSIVSKIKNNGSSIYCKVSISKLTTGTTYFYRFREVPSTTGIANDTAWVIAKVICTSEGSNVTYYRISETMQTNITNDLSHLVNYLNNDMVVSGDGIAFYNTSLTQISVTKKWIVPSGMTLPAASSVELTLYRSYTDEKEIEHKFEKVSVSSAPNTSATNQWVYTWSSLPKFYPDGSQITYYVKETKIPDTYVSSTGEAYDKTYVEVDFSTSETTGTATVTNTKYVSVTVNKNWLNDSEDKRWSKVSVELQCKSQGDTSYYSCNPAQKQILNKDNGWKCTFSNLPAVDSNGKTYEYTVAETYEDSTGKTTQLKENGAYVGGYQLSSIKSGTGTDGNTAITLTNKAYSIMVQKEWENSNGTSINVKDTEAFAPIKLQLMRISKDGATNKVQDITLCYNNKWQQTILDIDPVESYGEDGNSPVYYSYYIIETERSGTTLTENNTVNVSYYNMINEKKSDIYQSAVKSCISGKNNELDGLCLTCINTRQSYDLPETGSVGTMPFYLFGILTMLSSVMAGITICLIRRKI